MGSSKFVEAYEHDPRGQQKIITLIQVLEGLGCMAILGATFFPFMLSFVSFYMTLGVQPLLPYMSCVF